MSILHKENALKPWQVTWRLGPKRKRTSFKSLDSALAFDAACTQMAQSYGALIGKQPREPKNKSLRVADLARLMRSQAQGFWALSLSANFDIAFLPAICLW